MTSPGEDENKLADVIAPQPSQDPQDEVQQADQAHILLQCKQVNKAQHEADLAEFIFDSPRAEQARQVLPPVQIKLNNLSRWRTRLN